MRRKLVTSIAALLLVATCPACKTQPANTDSVLTFAGECQKTPRDTMPIVYDRTLDPEPLTENQRTLILDRAEPLAPSHQRVWFILVNYNRYQSRKEKESQSQRVLRCVVEVYFTPEETTSRIRKGHATYMISDEVGRPVRFHDALGQYMMVSTADRLFGDELALPERELWPFGTPDGLDDIEIVAIVDAARDWRKSQEHVFPDKNDPVLSIRWLSYLETRRMGVLPNRHGVIELDFGTQQHPLAGEGIYVLMKKKSGKWLVVKSGGWIS